ncbi:MAG: phosphoribosylformylglycinamidine synthase subunit PurL [Candidatus Diapherotrites archaeon]|nr:phosphoribosylformylglycinamidine synthase subunit PurL [Candidatus Diapherotrites archaeon]
MIHRIEVKSKHLDTRAEVRKKQLEQTDFGKKIQQIEIVDVYTLEGNFSEKELQQIANSLHNPVSEIAFINQPAQVNQFDYAIEIGYLPGVTDNIGNTVQEEIEDLLKRKFKTEEHAYSSQITFIQGKLTEQEAIQIGNGLANPLIQRIHIKNFEQFQKQKGMNKIVPKVKLSQETKVDLVKILEMTDLELEELGKKGIQNKDSSRRGPLALSLDYLKTIQAYFKELNRNPTDIELESLAQTWSEHCKHTIFAGPIDELDKGLYKTYIKGATEKIRKEKGAQDFCISVFTDNSGAIDFDENYAITHKVETHNSPSALDPFGGAITGIVGVNRDCIGFGLGAKPVMNQYGFCFGDPKDAQPLYKGANFTQKMLSPKQIMLGVIQGVNAGGNQSGIPTPQGFMYFDSRYKGKPLVFVGTVGLIPKTNKYKKLHEKKANSGEYVVVIGGRVGKDGIHGATFSSEAMDAGSPVTAVQIGDPITQKKLSDAIVKEARDLELYSSITDNGAGGLSCSIAEMAKESNGCFVELNKVPLKYPGLQPWEIWISESQERMTLSIPKEKWEKFEELMNQRGVEATIIGEFMNTGKCEVMFNGKKIMELDLEFLHNGLPKKQLKTTYTKPNFPEPLIQEKENLNSDLLKMIQRLNIASYEFISKQYDHEVQGGSVQKPLQGKGRVNSNATVSKPLLDSDKGVVLSQALYPGYSEIDSYAMAACAIDTAIRNVICAGANLKKMALLDNFCWCSPTESERLGQLKQAVKACYDYATVYGAPFISGKDSMFNDFKGFNEIGESVKISIPPTLLVTSIGVIENCEKTISLDFKTENDLIYIIGETFEELGGSEYYRMIEQGLGNSVPKVNGEKNKQIYEKIEQSIEKELITSAQSIGLGGFGIAVTKMSIAGQLGCEISLHELPGTVFRNEYALFSESQGRIIATINPENKKEFEQTLKGIAFKEIGKVTGNNVKINGLNGKEIANIPVDELTQAYKKTSRDY